MKEIICKIKFWFWVLWFWFYYFLLDFHFFYKSEQKVEQVATNTNINELLLRDYSYKMGDNQKKILVLLSFLDPECESCAIYSEVVKKLYKEYYKDIQIVVKYLDNHKKL